jgi:hypothetical protein
MIFWAPILHFYQPSFQDFEVLKKIDKECYKPLLNMLEEHPVKICVNINTILIDLLYEFGLGDTLDLFKNLESDNKIEILGTAKFHPIIPLLPQKEILNQIRLNEEDLKRIFPNWERNGFFPPELSISSKTAKYIQELGYKWVIISGISCPIDWPSEEIFCSPNGLQLFFRDDILSNKISFNNIKAKEFIQEMMNLFNNGNNKGKKDKYIITAMDAETFGHHIKKYERIFLSKTFDLIEERDEIKVEFISELDKYFPIAKQTIIPKDSSWSTSCEDLKNNNPYPLWNDTHNKIHNYYWKIVKSLNKLMDLADTLDLTKEWNIENYYNTAKWFYDRSICSDTTWWANPERGIWSPNIIYNGIVLLMKAALNAHLALIYANRDDGEVYYDSISYYHGLIMMEISKLAQRNLAFSS